MSLTAQVPLQSLVAVAGQTVFPFNFRCDDGTTIRVYLNDVLQGGATVALNADQTATPGGTVTLVAPAALNDVVSMERVTPPAQTLALTPYGAFGAVAFIAVLDKIVELVQEAGATLSRMFRVTRANLALFSSLDLPAPQDGMALTYAADPAHAGKFTLSSILAASKQYVNDTVQGVLGGGSLNAPSSWVSIADGILSSFPLAAAPFASADLYIVTIDGVPQEPNTAYSVNVTVNPAQLVLTGVPPANARIFTRTLGYAKGVNVADNSLVTAADSVTARPLSAWVGDTFNVKAYGAKGDGLTDDTLAIQKAITACTAGGTVLFPPGEYKLTAGLNVTVARTRLLGYGAKLTQTGAFQRGVTLTAVGCSVEGLWLYNTNGAAEWSDAPAGSTNAIGIVAGPGADGFKALNVHTENWGWAGIRLYQSKHMAVRGCEISGVGLTKPLVAGNNNNLGIECYLSGIGYPDIQITDNFLHDLAQGVYVGFDWQDILIAHNYILNIRGQHGMYIGGVSNLSVIANILRGCGQNGIKVQVSVDTTLPPTNVLIEANDIDTCGNAGIIVLPSQAGLAPRFINPSVIGNAVRNCSIGIDVDHSDNYTITDNTVVASATIGVRTRSENGSGRVAGNLVVSSQQTGLYLQARTAADLGIVETNYVIDAGLSGVGTSDLRAAINLSTGEWLARYNVITIPTAALGFSFASHATSVVTLRNNRTPSNKNNSLGSVALVYGRTAVGVAAGGTLVSNAQTTELYEETCTVAGTAWTNGAPINPTSDSLLVYIVRNTSAGALGLLTWDAIFKLAAWVQPGAGQSRAITFRFNGTNWVEVSRTPADVPN